MYRMPSFARASGAFLNSARFLSCASGVAPKISHPRPSATTAVGSAPISRYFSTMFFNPSPSVRCPCTIRAVGPSNAAKSGA